MRDIIELKDLIEKFGDQIPESEKKCLDESPELEKLKAKYPIDDKTEQKVITYITLHYLEVHKELGVLNSDWKAQKYYDTGKEGGKYAHKVVGSVAGSE